MKISLIIPAYNEEAVIGQCLESVIRNSEGKFCEIIVVNNASSDRTGEIAETFPGVRVVYEEKKGLTSARQRGLMEAQGDYLAYIDADAELPSEWFARAERIFASNPYIVSLSGPGRYKDGTWLQNHFLNMLWWVSAPLTYFFSKCMIFGSNFIACKDALEAIGGFDTTLEFYGEDTNIARRLHTVGNVLWRMEFYIYTSSRRYREEGFMHTAIKYTTNFMWEILFQRPFTKTHTDIRLSTPKNTKQ